VRVCMYVGGHVAVCWYRGSSFREKNQIRQWRKSTLASLRKRASVMKGPVRFAFPESHGHAWFSFVAFIVNIKWLQQENFRE
jgi:hypothetical protein